MYKVVRGGDETIRASEYSATQWVRRAAPLMGFAKHVLRTCVQHEQLQGVPGLDLPPFKSTNAITSRDKYIRNRTALTRTMLPADTDDTGDSPIPAILWKLESFSMSKFFSKIISW